MITVNCCPEPSQAPVPAVVFLVQDSSPLQTSNMQTSVASVGSQPRRASARELLPAPVGPTMTILGSGYSSPEQRVSVVEQRRRTRGNIVLE